MDTVDAKVPDKLKRTIGSHLWLDNMEFSAKRLVLKQRLVLKPSAENPPNSHRLTPMTKVQCTDSTRSIMQGWASHQDAQGSGH